MGITIDGNTYVCKQKQGSVITVTIDEVTRWRHAFMRKKKESDAAMQKRVVEAVAKLREDAAAVRARTSEPAYANMSLLTRGATVETVPYCDCLVLTGRAQRHAHVAHYMSTQYSEHFEAIRRLNYHDRRESGPEGCFSLSNFL